MPAKSLSRVWRKWYLPHCWWQSKHMKYFKHCSKGVSTEFSVWISKGNNYGFRTRLLSNSTPNSMLVSFYRSFQRCVWSGGCLEGSGGSLEGFLRVFGGYLWDVQTVCGVSRCIWRAIKTSQARTGQVKSGQVKSGQVKLRKVKSGQVQSGQVRKT